MLPSICVFFINYFLYAIKKRILPFLLYILGGINWDARRKKNSIVLLGKKRMMKISVFRGRSVLYMNAIACSNLLQCSWALHRLQRLDHWILENQCWTKQILVSFLLVICLLLVTHFRFLCWTEVIFWQENVSLLTYFYKNCYWK